MQLTGVPDDGAVEDDLGAPTRMPRQVLRGAELELDVAGPADDAHRLERIRRVDRRARAPRARRARAARSGPRRRAAAAGAAPRRCVAISASVGRRSTGMRLDRPGLAASPAPPARCRTARRRWRRGTRCAPTPPAARAAASMASCGRSASSGLSTVMVARRRIVGGQPPGVEDSRGQERRRQDLDETVERQRLSDRATALAGRGSGRARRARSAAPTGSSRDPRAAAPPRPGRRAARGRCRQLGGTTVTPPVGRP